MRTLNQIFFFSVSVFFVPMVSFAAAGAAGALGSGPDLVVLGHPRRAVLDQANLRRGATHVEGDDVFVAERAAQVGSRDDAGGRCGRGCARPRPPAGDADGPPTSCCVPICDFQ